MLAKNSLVNDFVVILINLFKIKVFNKTDQSADCSFLPTSEKKPFHFHFTALQFLQ